VVQCRIQWFALGGRDNKTVGLVDGGEFLDQMSDCQLLENDYFIFLINLSVDSKYRAFLVLLS
jgi:hypothetical protein